MSSNRQPLKNILLNVTIALACLLAFITVFENRLILPPYLQMAGRMHPLILHFPIVLFLLFIVYKLLIERRIKDVSHALITSEWLLLLTAFTSVLTALMGLFLAKEPGYDAEALQWHKWAGIGATVIILVWYAFHGRVNRSYVLTGLLSLAGVVTVVLTGHLGAGITHGEDFIMAPIDKEQQAPVVPMEEAIVFDHMVKPILDAKCVSCHNTKKAKGELIMESQALLLKGGRSGSLWDLNEADLGLLLRRVHLPADQKKHMPPAGKPQLTDDEIAILTAWIKKGSDFKLKVLDLPAKDSLYAMAIKTFSSAENETYDFPAADEKKVAALNIQNRVVRELALESPAVTASFFNASLFKPEQLKDLLSVKEQLVWLNLNKMPVKDDDLKVISQFVNLRRLNLAFTSISGAALRELQKLKNLKELSLSGVPLKEADVKVLSSLPELKKVYLWNTGLQPNDVAALKKTMKQVLVETGYRGDTVVIQLTPPLLENEEQIIKTATPLKLKNYIKGTTIRYTLDGSDPDSLSSPVYNDKVVVDKNITLKAKAFKPGWISSDIMETIFLRNTYSPDSVIAITPFDQYWKGNGILTLSDGKKGDMNNRLNTWLGYKNDPMEVLYSYHNAITASSVTLSALIDINGYIMPPAFMEVWGGMEKDKLQPLGKLVPTQPDSVRRTYLQGFDINFKPIEVKYLKLVVRPVAKLPAWHRGKGEKGWVFTDEVVVN